jgi:hypothetical protein
VFRSRLRRPSPALIVSCLALVAAMGGVAIADPLDSAGRVHLCFNQTWVDAQDGNEVVAVNDEDACPADYPQRLVINQTGPKGAPGPKGATGPQGPKGAIGAAGGTELLDALLAKKLEQDLAKLDSKLEKRDDLLDTYRVKLAKLERARGQIEADVLARQQRELARQVQAVMEFLSQLARSQSAVARELSKP